MKSQTRANDQIQFLSNRGLVQAIPPVLNLSWRQLRMVAIQLTDKSGHWFDVETSVKLPERTWFDGNNHISANTGSQWSHEALYYTRNGNWILEQSQGHADHYVMVDQEEAIGWVSHNDIYGGDEFNELPEEAQQVIREQLKTLEV